MSASTMNPPNLEPNASRHRRWYRDPSKLIPTLLVLLGFSLLYAFDMSSRRFSTDVIARRDEIFSLEYASSILPDIFRGMYTTMRATVLAFLITVTLGLILAILRRAKLKIIAWPTAFIIEFIRSTPILVQFVFAQQLARVWFGLNVTSVSTATQLLILGLGVHYATYASEAYRAGIDSVPKGQWEASTALNLSPVTKWTRVIIPQAVPNILPTLGNYLVAALKDAPIAGPVLAVPGVMFAANTFRSDDFRAVEPMLLAGVAFLLVSLPLAWLVRRLEKRIGYERT